MIAVNSNFNLKTGFLLLICLFQLVNASARESPEQELKHTLELSNRFPDSAFILLKKLHHHALAANDKKTIGMCLQQMGKICYAQGHYAQSLDYHQQADKIFRQLQEKNLLADNFNDMGVVYYQNFNKKSSRKQYDQALKLYRNTNNKIGLGETYGHIGHLYEKQQRYDSAFYYQRHALKEYQKAGYKQGVAKIYENLGSIHEDLVHYDSAKYYFDASLSLYQAVNNEVSSIEVINNLGDILRKTGDYKQGLLFTRKALSLSIATKNEYQQASAYRDIAKSFNLLNLNDSAYHYMELSRKHLLHLYSDENNKQMSFLQIIYSIDKKNDEIAALENNRKLNLIVSVAVVVVIVLLIVMGLLTISRQRLKLRENTAIADKNEQLNRAQQEQLEHKSRELTTHTLQVIQHNNFLDNLRNKLEEMIKEDKRDQKRQLLQLVRQINQNINHDQQWKDFTQVFEQLHQSFFDSLKTHCEELTVNDIRLIALLKMNMSSKDMAVLFGISQDSLRVARYRLRKKLNISQGDNLSTFIQTI
ncbi:tetratricopeptide repeat protein [Pedobacter sp. PAMC26386]|nr:tetratricopeptide repeat protein [Pedobacter sp. PAMC26386]